ncbi:hypothetical protein JCM5353_006169 [Sporobolomyces roseus]
MDNIEAFILKHIPEEHQAEWLKKCLPMRTTLPLFSCLPNELLRLIVELAIPSTFHSTAYKDRQSNLRSFCLISRRFRDIAQPHLLQIVWIRSPEQLDKVLERLDSTGRKDLVRQVALRALPTARYDGPQLERLAGHGGNLRSVALDVPYFEGYSKRVDLSFLQLLPKLTNLVISNNGYNLPSPIVLPALKSLSIEYEAMISPGIPSLLTPTALPLVRSLGAVGVALLEEDHYPPERFPAAALLPQLHSLVVEAELVELVLDDFRPRWDRTLVESNPADFDEFAILSKGVQHIRFRNLTHYADVEAFDAFTKLIEVVGTQDPVRLRSIYLDQTLKPHRYLSPEIKVKVEELMTFGVEKGIEVVFEEQTCCGNTESHVSHEFHSRREKEIEEAGAK